MVANATKLNAKTQRVDGVWKRIQASHVTHLSAQTGFIRWPHAKVPLLNHMELDYFPLCACQTDKIVAQVCVTL